MGPITQSKFEISNVLYNRCCRRCETRAATISLESLSNPGMVLRVITIILKKLFVRRCPLHTLPPPTPYFDVLP